MSQTEFTGKAMSFTWNSKTLGGVTKVDINEQNAPVAEPLDVTASGDTAYTELADPLGAKGTDKCKVTITLQDSTASYADALQTKFAFNSAQAATFDMAVGTANANTWTHSGLELTERTTEIPFDGFATCTLVFEANSLGTWDSPA